MDTKYLSNTNEYVLILFIISYFPSFSNSYDLNKILSWKFGIINLFDLSSNLIERGLIRVKEDKKVNREYKITAKGKESLKKNILNLKIELEEKFKNEKEFIDILFKNSFPKGNPS